MKFRKDKDSMMDDVSIISEGMEVRGNINTVGSLRLDGKVYGNIHAGGIITIGSHGEVHGDISAHSLTNGGVVIGSLVSEEKITLESKSRLKGDLTGKILVIEEGALFVGKSSMETGEQPRGE